jgi:hypothetical protein
MRSIAMAYVYLLDMGRFLEQRIAAARNARENVNDSPSEEQFLDGRTSALLDFQEFLIKNYIPRLPRRIRETYLKKDN